MIKGVHPGFVLDRELKKRKIRKGFFALSLNEFPQTIVSITKGKRKMNTELSLKIETTLGIEEGFFMTLQIFYDINEAKKKLSAETPDLKKLRPVLFWDTNLESIDWQRYKTAVVKRVFERGNKIEKNEIIRFYGKEGIDKILKNYD
ncbi:MAG: plasmid maintenance system antidote protein [Bacteroidetes bacterium RIFOXYC12_FULL_35_7]|nr:MAG: plasmid maintenance system antidote protein [Bacteroidetes bacterium RIFOXYC12_FULL_35_7]